MLAVANASDVPGCSVGMCKPATFIHCVLRTASTSSGVDADLHHTPTHPAVTSIAQFLHNDRLVLPTHMQQQAHIMIGLPSDPI